MKKVFNCLEKMKKLKKLKSFFFPNSGCCCSPLTQQRDLQRHTARPRMRSTARPHSARTTIMLDPAAATATMTTAATQRHTATHSQQHKACNLLGLETCGEVRMAGEGRDGMASKRPQSSGRRGEKNNPRGERKGGVAMWRQGATCREGQKK